MKKLTTLLALVALASCFTACADEEEALSPGTLTVNWTHGDVATCAAREITSLRVWIGHPSDETLSTSQIVDCPDDATSGEVLFEEVTPAVYEVGVDGIRADEQVYYQGLGSVEVGDGADAVTVPAIKLEQRKSTLHVEWNVWDKCNKAEAEGLNNITILVYEESADQPMATLSGSCEAEFSGCAHTDPAGGTGYGVLFTELEAVNAIVVIKALDGEDLDTAALIGSPSGAEDMDGVAVELNASNQIPLQLNPGQAHYLMVDVAKD